MSNQSNRPAALDLSTIRRLPSQPPSAAAPPSSLSEIPPDQREPHLRSVFDPIATRQRIFQETFQAIQQMPPLENDEVRLQLKDVQWADPERFSRSKRKEAILAGQTLGRRIRGTWELVDKQTGKVIDQRTQIVARVPYMTSMGTFTHRGNDYTLSNQQRLRAGIYTRIKDNGEIEAHANLLPGKGLSHRYFVDPAKGVFKVRIGQSEMPLMPLLKAMGASDEEIAQAWGKDLLAANYQENDPKVLLKLQQRLLRKHEQADAADERALAQKLTEAFARMELDPSVTQRTLGQPYTSINKDVILATTKKLLAVSRREQEPDDRDHLAFQRFLGPEDLFRERIERDHGRLRYKTFQKIAQERSLKKMPSGLITEQLEQALLGSGLGRVLEQINPAEVLDNMTLLTRMGEGGIPSPEAVPDEARGVQPSHLGFVDPVRTPESFRVGVDVHFARNTRKGPDGQMYTQLVDQRTGKTVWLNPQELSDAAIATPDVLRWDTKRVPVMRGGRLDYVPKSQIQYVLPAFESTFSPLGNLVPLKSAIKPGRLMMGSKYIAQALPLASPEAPLVRGAMPNTPDTSFEEEYASFMGAVRAKQAGKVLSVDGGTVKVQYADGSKDEIDLYQNHPFNRKSVTGDSVIFYQRRGQVYRTRLDAYQWQDGDCTLSLYPPTRQPAWLPVTGFLAHANTRSLWRLTTAGGRQVTVTEDHSLLTVDAASGQLVPILPADCRPRQTLIPVVAFPAVASASLDDTGLWLGLWLAEGLATEQMRLRRTTLADAAVALAARLGLPVQRRGNTLTWVAPEWLQQLRSVAGQIDWLLAQPVHFRQSVVVGMLSRLGSLRRDGNRKAQLFCRCPDASLQQYLVEALLSLGLAVDRDLRSGGLRLYREQLRRWPCWSIEPSFAAQLQRRLLTASPSERAVPAGWEQSPVVWDTITTIEPLGQRAEIVYDLCVPASECFVVADGWLVHNTHIHQEFLLKPGDTFEANQLLAKSNYTDKDGVMAVGANFRTAYLPWRGYNFKDAVVISESAAKRLSSEHMYQHQLETSDQHQLGRKTFLSIYPKKFTPQQLELLDENGVIKPGQRVEYGQPLVVALREQELAHNKLHKRGQRSLVDASIVWKHSDPGVVTDVYQSKDGPVVLVKAISPMQVGDKITGRYGDKGVVAAIVPDDQMPQDSEGRSMEVLLSPLITVSRTNPAHQLEAWLGKLARKTGKPIKVPDFDKIEDLVEWTQQQLAKHGLSDQEDLLDPAKQRKIARVTTGERFLMKLHHTSESKEQARNSGGYTLDDTPAKGGESGCFTADTLVRGLTETVPIGQLVAQKRSLAVPCYDPATGRLQAGWVSDWFCYRVAPQEILELELEDGSVLHVTRNHRMYRSDGSTLFAEELCVGDDLLERKFDG